ncbi:MAG: trigger factor [Peptostreptococcaceae bacterium]|nr:trigger factor [Peptostreptococcaceae bacterium]
MSQILSHEKNVVKFSLEIEADAFENAIQKAYQKNKGKFNIQGFRKGKATRAMIEKLYGEGVFYDEAIDLVFPEAYTSAIEELELDVIDRPSVDIESIGKGEKLVMTVEVQVKPEVKLGEYKGLEVSKVESEVTDEDIDHEIGHMLENNARLVAIEDRPVKDGDIILFDFLGKVDGVAFDGGKAENYELTVGSGSFIPGFEEQLVGLEIGQEKDIEVRFPEEYHSEDLKGKDAVFTVKVNEIKEKQIPALDDDFVAEATEFETVEELRKSIADDMKNKKAEYAQNAMRNEVVSKLADVAEVEIPQVMVDNEVEAMFRDFEQNLRYQGLDLESYFKYSGTSREDLAENMKGDAEKRVKISLALEAVSKLENITATEEDLNEEYQKMADMYKMEVEKIKEIFKTADNGLTRSIVSRKTVDLLLDNSKSI